MAEKSIPNPEVTMTDNGRPDPARSDAPGTADPASHESRFAIEYDGMTERELFRSVIRSIREHRAQTHDLRRDVMGRFDTVDERLDKLEGRVQALTQQVDLSDRGVA